MAARTALTLPSDELGAAWAALCRADLWTFVREAFAVLHPGQQLEENWHLELICEYLMLVERGSIRRLIINVPPRSLKSFICSIAFPAWCWLRQPGLQFICGSYSERLAIRHSVLCRHLVESLFYRDVLGGPKPLKGQNEKLKFVNERLGHRIAAGVGGTVLGEGCDILVVDDPHNPKQAFSAAERYRANVIWHDQTLTSRFNHPPTSREVIVMQRLHVDDLTGHVLSSGAWDWTVLRLPTRAKHDEEWVFPLSGRVVRRRAGELLHPSRWGEAEDAEARARLGPYGYAAQHDQEPVPLGGGAIREEWFPRWKRLPPEPDEVVISADTAIRQHERANVSCFSVFVRKENQWYLADVRCGHWDFGEQRRIVVNLADRYRPVSAVLVEEAATGAALVSDLRAATSLPVVPVRPRRGKAERLEEGLAQLAAGLVALPQESVGAPWLPDVLLDLAAFPTPQRWDFLDTLSQFLWYLRGRRTGGPRVLVL